MTDPLLLKAYIARQPAWYAEMMRLNRFLGEVAQEAAANSRRVKPVVVVERIGSGARTVVRRQAVGLNIEAYDVRPGLSRFPEVDDAAGWAGILSPFGVSMPIVEVGDPKGLDGETGALDAIRALHLHAPDDKVMLLASTFHGMPDWEAARMVAEACGIDSAEVATFTLADPS